LSYLSFFTSIRLSFFCSIYLPLFQTVLFQFISFYLSFFSSVYLSFFSSIFLSFPPIVYLSFFLHCLHFINLTCTVLYTVHANCAPHHIFTRFQFSPIVISFNPLNRPVTVGLLPHREKEQG
jgi:hypothetical protein